ncbi:MAG: L,D-transpeptidase family protein [Gammaproteobacteria bacterium]
MPASDLPLLNQARPPHFTGVTFWSWPDVQGFYHQRDDRPAWTGDRAATRDLLSVLRSTDQEGLEPADYHLDAIEQRLKTSFPTTAEREQLELLLTDAALRYAHDQQRGRYEPRAMDPQWLIPRPAPSDDTSALQTALAKQQLAAWLATLPPPHRNYAQLKVALAHYRTLAAQADWPVLATGDKLAPGQRDARVATLRRRMTLDGDYQPRERDDPRRYDAALANAVRQFQIQQGLDSDGVIGDSTRRALNISATQRVAQLRANLERWRWLPRPFETHYIRVNMPAFVLQVMEDDQPVLSMQVIVGRQLRSTPAMTSQLTHIIFNPYWTIPPSIAGKDILPKLRSDPAFLSAQNIQVFADWNTKTPIDPQTIDWSQYSEKHFPFRLRQQPGPKNSLGQVKFLLPNPYGIYLHDTPSRALFHKSVRAFSSGCIRLQKPNELAQYLLRDNPRWNPDAIAAVIADGTTRTVTLLTPEPVYLLYMTAWSDADSVVQFRDDIYERDQRLEARFENVNY